MKVYKGDRNCEGILKSGSNCRNKASFTQDDKYLCGVHSKKDSRTELPSVPYKVKKERKAKLENEEKRLAVKSDTPKIILHKLRMRKRVELEPGFISIYPNYRHSTRGYFDCSRLSPMWLGPVIHNLPGLPDAHNLENFWQFSKRYEDETEEEFLKFRINGYNDSTPHRRKMKGKVLYAEYNGVKYNYIESRFIYCYLYSKLVHSQAGETLDKLKNLYNEGYNIRIVGYDAEEVDYYDSSKPFGHEAVLAAILENRTPWMKQYHNNRSKYDHLPFVR